MTETLPRDITAEKYIIGCLVKFPDAADEIFSRLTATDFFDAEHAKIFRVAQQQHAAGGVDPVLLASETGSAQVLVDLSMNPHNAPSTSAHISGEVATIIEARVKRQLFIIGRDIQHAAMNGKPADSIVREAQADLGDINQERNAGKQPLAIAYEDLKAMHRKLNPIVIEGIAREGETMNIVAPAKFGKSWLLHYILLCIAADRYVFGRFRTSPGKVILIDNELHAATLVHRIQSVAQAMGLNDSDFADKLTVWPLRGKMPTLMDLHPMMLEIEPGTVKAIGYDAMYRFISSGASENDNAAMKEIYNALDSFAGHTKAVNIVVHHSSKGDQSNKAVTDVGAGAGSQSRAADTHLVLRQHEEPGVAVLESAIRSFAPIDPLPLRWSFPLWIPETGVDPKLLRGRLRANEQHQIEKDREGVKSIVDAIRKSGPATARQLRTRTGLSRERQERLLHKMQSEGQLTVTTTNIRGNECDEYSLPKQAE